MKILYITGQIAIHGGIERVTAMKVNYWAEHTDHEVYLSTYKQNHAPFIYPVSPKVIYEDLGIGYDVDYSTRPLYTFRQFKHVPKHIWKTFQLINRIQPDVIIVPNFDYEFWFIPMIKRRSKIVREYHSSLYACPSFTKYSKYWFKKKFDDFVQRKYDRVVVLTPDEIDYFSYKKNVVVIPNPIEVIPHKSLVSSKQIISIGRIHPVKQFDHLIDIASMVLRCHPEFTFVIYGDGDLAYLEKLQKKIQELGLEGKVFFPGNTENVAGVLCDSSIYLCTSKEESFGVSIVEAQESGLPVVSYDCPNGPKNIINDGIDGFLVPLGNKSTFANRINTIIEDSELMKRMSLAAIKNAENYQVERVMKQWISLFLLTIQ